jgi:hypothetical protein
MNVLWRNPPMRAKESRNRNMMRLPEQSLELVSIFKEARRNFIFNFLQGRLKI